MKIYEVQADKYISFLSYILGSGLLKQIQALAIFVWFIKEEVDLIVLVQVTVLIPF